MNSENLWTTTALQNGDLDAIKQRATTDPTYLRERDHYGNTPLLSAVGFDNVDLVSFLLDHGADPNIAVDDGYTCLHTAIESESPESTEMVRLLIKAGADIHAVGINGGTPLHMAAIQGRLEKAQLLIFAGADVNRRKEIDAEETPLMESAFMGKPEMVRLLLEHSADASMKDSMNHRTPLEIARHAAKGPAPEVVKFLREENISVDTDSLFADMDLPAEQLTEIKQTMANFDMAQIYIDNSKEIAASGNHAAVIKILSDIPSQ